MLTKHDSCSSWNFSIFISVRPNDVYMKHNSIFVIAGWLHARRVAYGNEVKKHAQRLVEN